MRGMRVAIAGLLLVALAGCLPVTSEKPVGTTVGLKADAALPGVWKGKMPEGKAYTYFTFLPGKDGGLTAVGVTPAKAGDEGGWAAFAATTAEIGGARFMNVRQTHSDGEGPTDIESKKSFPLLYRLTGKNRLALLLLDEKKTAEAIRAGKIKGTVESGSYGDVTLTADGVELDAFLSSKDGLALFTPLLELTRVE